MNRVSGCLLKLFKMHSSTKREASCKSTECYTCLLR
uniref:Uncharacterized protein n=1 Tax=Anguilla anguilla TaxID=7936 RepID=A0A0E9TMI9_ANGAN